MFSSLMQRLNERRAAEFELEGSADAGFTLIELMVVLLILAILLAIAIPTFLGVTGGANDRAAQSNLNTALTTAKAMATQNNQLYVDKSTTPAQTAASQLAVIVSNEPSIKFVAGAANVQGQVSVYFDAGGQGVVLASPSKNGSKCWYAVDNLQVLTAAAANGAYGGTAIPGGDATDAPSGAGSYYTSGSQTSSACDASVVPVGAGTWKTNGF
jgi:type IV pilus assembly protein PilA